MSAPRLLGCALALVVGCFGLLGSPAASARNCLLIVDGSCPASGSCTVGVAADCDGVCTVVVDGACPAGTTCRVVLLDTCADGDAGASDDVAVEGSGTITPALPCTNCTINFVFTAVVAGDEISGSSGCQFNGYSNGREDELRGGGSGNVSGCAVSGGLTYERMDVLLQVHGNLRVNGVCHDIATSALLFVPTSDPITTFIVTGTVVLEDATC